MVGYSPWGHKESDTIERLHFHFRFHRLSSVPQDYLHYRCQPQMGSPGYQHFSLDGCKCRGLTAAPTVLAAAAAKLLQSCPTLFDPIDGSPPGSPVPGILQARTLEWVAISFSNAGKWKVKVKTLSRVWLLATPWLQPTRLLPPWDFPGKRTGVGCHCLLCPLSLGLIIY